MATAPRWKNTFITVKSLWPHSPIPVVMANQEALLHDADTPAYGPEKAKVAVIEFLDYQCLYCYNMAWEIEKVMKTNPEVRFVFKVLTIYAGKWPSSEQAAQRGLAVWKAKGEQAYMTYHNKLFNTMHMNGELTTEDIDNAAMAAGFVANSIPDTYIHKRTLISAHLSRG
ncbi:thioredoxin domain-containing protein [Cronobacter sakazakii]|nr:thioredoxin domain-containing protein [Cronobacter sakazakii]MDU7230007.1 thioredoxin domain-containing protein [Cronobacter sakazakii]